MKPRGCYLASLAPGRVVQIPEDAYRFGEGLLRLRVAEVTDLCSIDGAHWAEVRGETIDHGGAVLERDRLVLVRLRGTGRGQPNG